MESVEGSVFNTDEITLVLFGLHRGNLDERGNISIKSSEATYCGYIFDIGLVGSLALSCRQMPQKLCGRLQSPLPVLSGSLLFQFAHRKRRYRNLAHKPFFELSSGLVREFSW